MGLRGEVERAMPALLRHEGTWVGRYQTVDLDGRVVDEHESRVECVFPDAGPWHYLQRNRFQWSDGRVHEVEFGGVLRDERIFWDVETFSGYAWTTADDVILLNLARKDRENASFLEIIVAGEDGETRGRTWHWFEKGRLFQRTLCNERRIEDGAR